MMQCKVNVANNLLNSRLNTGGLILHLRHHCVRRVCLPVCASVFLSVCVYVGVSVCVCVLAHVLEFVPAYVHFCFCCASICVRVCVCVFSI